MHIKFPQAFADSWAVHVWDNIPRAPGRNINWKPEEDKQRLELLTSKEDRVWSWSLVMQRELVNTLGFSSIF